MLLKLVDFPTVDEYGVHIRVLHPNPVDMEKLAGEDYTDELKKFASTIEPRDGKVVAIINALGAGEYYGSNNNGDYFTEPGLIEHHKTFYDAHPYEHHKNKDPNRAHGKILFARYNPRMHRVELIVEIDKEKSPVASERIEKGDYPETSMGCKCPYDICSICGHKASNVKNYCTHLKNQMGQVLPGGKRVCAITTIPRFFDISFVFRGADRTSRVLQKVAGEEVATCSAVAGEEYYKDHMVMAEKAVKEVEMDEHEKVAYDAVVNMLDSFCDEYIPILENSEPVIKPELMNKLASEYTPEQIISTTANMGIILKPQEYQRMILVKAGQEGVADEWDRQGIVIPCDIGFEDAIVEPHLVEEQYINEKVAEELAGYMPERSALEPHFSARVVRTCKRSSVLNKTAAEEKRDLGASPSMLPLLAFLGLGYMAYRKIIPLSKMGKFDRWLAENPKFAIPVLGTTAAGIMGAGKIANPDVPMSYIRKEAAFGIPMPTITLPIGAAYVYGQHVRNKARRGHNIGHVSAMMAEHPFATGLLGSVAISAMKARGAQKLLSRAAKKNPAAKDGVGKLIKGAEERLLHPHELGKLASAVGDVVAEYLAFRSLPGAVLDTILFRSVDKAGEPKEKAGG